MKITVEPLDDHAILHLAGEFDTYYCNLLQEEVDKVLKTGVNNIVLNLRMTRFINSTALGAMIKVSKTLEKLEGKLAISRPSAFCKRIIENVGLDRRIKVYDSDEAAIQSMRDPGAADAGDDSAVFEEDPSSVLFTLVDKTRLEHFIQKVKAANPVHGHSFGSAWSGRGGMAGLDEDGLRFTWNGGKTDLTAFDMGQMLAIGTALSVKFRLPLLQRGFCTAAVEIEELEERVDGVKVGARFTEIDDGTRDAVRQYAKDMAFLKAELTEGDSAK
ncbi:MAG: anti-anti-sigma factor [Planctomycetota bacterium]|jgi:anti-anti-sigma factor